MTLREDLEKAIRHADGVQTQDAYTLASDYAMDLIRDHGPALLEAVDRANRYEAVRKMNPPTFTKVFNENVSTDIPFDQLVDTWAFNHGYPSVFDKCRSES